MRILRLFMFFLAGPFQLEFQTLASPSNSVSVAASPFLEAEQSFLRELNSTSGIELAGGPFTAGEQHQFGGESGYFVLAPSVSIPTLDQRLSIQTRRIHLSSPPPFTNSLPIVAPGASGDEMFTAADRREIFTVLASHGFAKMRDEITAVDFSTVQIRPVLHLPFLKLSAFLPATKSADANSQPAIAIALLGAQPWQGIPLYRASFNRHDESFAPRQLAENTAIRPAPQLSIRPPILAPQTFFAPAGLAPADWRKLLRNLATIDLPAVEILDANVSEGTVTLDLDSERPNIPQQWVKFEKRGGRWQILQAVEFRAEFPRPGAWWTFLPLLPSPQTPTPDRFPASSIPQPVRREIISIVSRLRGAGSIIQVDSTDSGSTVFVRTASDLSSGYILVFARQEGAWRFSSVTPWRDVKQ
jgi:hypothetical protein